MVDTNDVVYAIVRDAIDELEETCKEGRTPDASVPRAAVVATINEVFSNRVSDNPDTERQKADVMSRMFTAISRVYDDCPADGIVTWELLLQELDDVIVDEETGVVIHDVR